MKPQMIQALATIAPGRPLRDGLDRVLQASKGALVIVGDGPEVLEICSGGFLLDAEFSPQRLSELAKMDGAIILASDSSRIARANVHLVPNPRVPTSETGTRHRTAERVARSIDVPVITVSEDLAVITMYRGDSKHILDTVVRLLGRANQALSTLERYRSRLDTVTSALTALEIEDLVTARDVISVLQRAEMVRRIRDEVDAYVAQLGTDGRLVHLQVEELMGSMEDERRLVVADYAHDDDSASVDAVLGRLGEIETERLPDPDVVAAALMLPGTLDPAAGTPDIADPDALDPDSVDLEAELSPRGYRLLSKVPRLPQAAIARIIARYGQLQKVMRATPDELEGIQGVDAYGSRNLKEALERLAESSIIDRFG